MMDLLLATAELASAERVVFAREPRRTASEIDATTLEACQKGDRAALEHFVRHYENQVFAFLSRAVGRGPQVEDLAQEVFLRAYRALPRFELRDDVRVSTWLVKIAVRLLQDTRKRHQPQLVELPDDLTASHQAHPEQLRRRREIVEAFERAAAQLPQAQRTVFVLAEFHALSMAQIGELTGATTATVKTRLHRARRHLRLLLSNLWEAP